jgi:hypothetical protein
VALIVAVAGVAVDGSGGDGWQWLGNGSAVILRGDFVKIGALGGWEFGELIEFRTGWQWLLVGLIVAVAGGSGCGSGGDGWQWLGNGSAVILRGDFVKIGALGGWRIGFSVKFRTGWQWLLVLKVATVAVAGGGSGSGGWQWIGNGSAVILRGDFVKKHTFIPENGTKK